MFSKLVGARTFAERMFHVVVLGRLNEDECRQAISIPVKQKNCPVTITEPAIVAMAENRYGKYAFAVPLLGKFIRRQQAALN